MRVKFYLTSSGRSPVEEVVRRCSRELQADFLDAVSLLTAGETLSMPLSRSLGRQNRGLYELRLRDHAGIVRVFYFTKKGDAIYMLHAFKKKSQKSPKKELDVAMRRIKEL